jgi:hypothetical protein
MQTLTAPPSSSESDRPTKSGLDAFTLNSKQQLVLHEDNWSNEILFGGAKYGGKSFLMRYIFTLLCLNCPGILCYLFRRTFDDLWKNHMEGPTAFPAMLAPYVNEGKCAIVRSEVRWANGARIFLNHLQLSKHVSKYQGQDIHALGIDEATQFEEKQIRYLFGSVRRGGWKPQWEAILRRMETDGTSEMVRNLVARLPIIIMGANPGGVSHKFIKTRFIDNGAYHIVDDKAFKRQFIPARAEDNPNKEPDYLDRLEEMGGPALVRAMREGDWNVVSGGMFSQWRNTMFSRPWHVHPGFRVPVGWPLWRAGDDGFTNPTAIYWMTEDPVFGTLYVVDELYKAQMLPDEVAERVKERDLTLPLQDAYGQPFLNTERLRGSYDSNAFAVTGTGTEREGKDITRGEQMNRLGCRWEPVEKWPGSRKARITNFHRLLAPNPKAPLMKNVGGGVVTDPDGKQMHDRPGIVFFAKCVNAIERIPAMLRSERDPEDLDDNADDHSFDGVTYAVQHRRGKARMIAITGV